MVAEHEKQATILFVLIAAIAIVAVVITVFNLWSFTVILILILAVLLFLYTQINTFFAQLQEYERAVVFYMGKFKEVAGPGWLFLIPFIETYVRVDLRIKTYDIKPQDVITKDNIRVHIDAVIYAQVKDPKAAILNVDDYEVAMKSYIQATLRSVIGKMSLTNMISEITQVNEILKGSLQQISSEWGIAVAKVEIQAVDLPKDVQDAMHEFKAAEHKKFAQVERAEAKKITIEAIQAGASQLTKPTLQYLYLQSLEKIAQGKSSKIIFPIQLVELAQNLTEKFGTFAKAQDAIVGTYKKKREEKPKQPDGKTIAAIAKEFGVHLPVPHHHPKKKPKKKK